MKRIILTLILISIISCQTNNNCNYIEDYYQNVYLAEEAYYKEDFQKVFELMSEAEKNCNLLNQSGIYEMLKYAESAAKIEENGKALELIRLLILKGYEIDNLANNEAFIDLIGSAGWTQLENDYETLRGEYLNNIDLELREKIAMMRYNDQYHRSLLMENNSGNEINEDSIWNIINKTDSINETELKDIILKHGFPDERIIGGYNIDNEFIDPNILLFHFDDYEFWTVELKKLIVEGKAPPRSLGNFVDSYNRRLPEDKKFIYGIYDNVGEKNIVDYENLNKRRISIGLPPRELKKRIDSLKRVYYGY